MANLCSFICFPLNTYTENNLTWMLCKGAVHTEQCFYIPLHSFPVFSFFQTPCQVKVELLKMCTLSHIFKHQNWLEAELVRPRFFTQSRLLSRHDCALISFAVSHVWHSKHGAEVKRSSCILFYSAFHFWIPLCCFSIVFIYKHVLVGHIWCVTEVERSLIF